MQINIEKNQRLKFGILEDKNCINLFRTINKYEKSSICRKCQKEREKYKQYDKKEGIDNHKYYSNLLPGFSSQNVYIPLDLLIIGQAHGGGRKEDFRKQKNLNFEINNIGKFYLNDNLIRFHQKIMREFFSLLDKKTTWVFTDLIKCYVWDKKDEYKNILGSHNKKTAIKFCKEYLDNQIEVLKPKIVLILGNIVAKNFKIKDYQHGQIFPIINYNKNIFEIIFSIFPSQITADKWIENKGWEPIMKQINQTLKNNKEK